MQKFPHTWCLMLIKSIYMYNKTAKKQLIAITFYLTGY